MPRINRRLLHATATALLAWAGLLSAGLAAPADAPAESLQQRIDRLIQELGHQKYAVRERAQEELAELGFEAYEALSAAANHEDLEIATRAKYLLLLIPAQWSIENEPEEVRRYLTYYQSQSPEIRIAVLKELARMPGGAGLAALCRLVRFEKSTVWSKHAAAELLNGEPVDPSGRERWTKAVREHLGQGNRPAAQWLRTYLAIRDDPKAALPQLAAMADDESQLLKRAPDESDPRIAAALLYHVAMAQAAQGDKEQAEKTAQQACELAPSRSPTRLTARLDVAAVLQQRGRLGWAEAEYRRVIEAAQASSRVIAGLRLAEMRHDQGDELAAAAALQDVLQVDAQELERVLNATGRAAPELRARMSYFHACHWEKQGDRAQQRKFLDEALQHDPNELDALIARYRLPDADPEYRRQTVQLIEKAAAKLHMLIGEAPDEPAYYNQFAWLVGNTEGDRDEALRCAKKAVELEPETGAYLDTLAHVYFGRGDLENAVKFQSRAAELEPYSGLIAEKLAVFRKALEERKKP